MVAANRVISLTWDISFIEQIKENMFAVALTFATNQRLLEQAGSDLGFQFLQQVF